MKERTNTTEELSLNKMAINAKIRSVQETMHGIDVDVSALSKAERTEWAFAYVSTALGFMVATNAVDPAGEVRKIVDAIASECVVLPRHVVSA